MLLRSRVYEYPSMSMRGGSVCGVRLCGAVDRSEVDRQPAPCTPSLITTTQSPTSEQRVHDADRHHVIMAPSNGGQRQHDVSELGFRGCRRRQYNKKTMTVSMERRGCATPSLRDSCTFIPSFSHHSTHQLAPQRQLRGRCSSPGWTAHRHPNTTL